MNVTLNIPDEIMATLPTAPRERDARLLLELAVALYAKGTVSLSQGAAMAGLSRMDFGVEVGERGIPRHYGADELAEDVVKGYEGRADYSAALHRGIAGRCGESGCPGWSAG